MFVALGIIWIPSVCCLKTGNAYMYSVLQKSDIAQRNEVRVGIYRGSFFVFCLIVQLMEYMYSIKKKKCILCVSRPSANKLSAILFLLFARSRSNSPQSFQRFRQPLRRNFNWIRQQMKNFPLDPHC